MSSIEPEVSPREISRSGLCIGCGGCAALLDLDMRLDRYGQYRPVGEGTRRRSATVAAVCPFSPSARNEDQIAAERFAGARLADPRVGRFLAAYVGHASEEGYRPNGSSGGLASWVAAELLRLGLVDGVAHVVPRAKGGEGPLFHYRVARSIEELNQGAKSRYYPVEMSSVLREIRSTPGRYAVVGIPCFIKSVHLLRAADPVLAERIVYTLGLFCGHMKSARMAESFAWQMQSDLADLDAIDFRHKDESRPANWYQAALDLRDGERRSMDWWHMVDGDWGAGFFQYPACDFCDDVVAETADISFGDAWVEPYSSDGRGTNVVIVRDPVLHYHLREAATQGRVVLNSVDAEFVANTQAAGLRHRREGLAYRLGHRRHGIVPVKRFATRNTNAPTARRRAVYWLRQRISRWSHRVFWLSRAVGVHAIYLDWAKATLACYQALTYSRGRWAWMFDKVFRP